MYQYPPYIWGPKTNGWAIASLVLGILWMWGITSVLALVFGLMAKKQIDQSNGLETGNGFAVAGIVLGVVGIAGALLIVALLVVVGASAGGGS